MARSEHVLVVFVASSSEMEPERNRLEEVIQDLNVSWSRTLGVRLELVRWETHGFPGVGEDPQDVLNRELPNDYDIFIGLMWTRFGTPTGRAGSGTEEEFCRAHKRFREDPNSVKIMFYFKEEPVSPSAVNPDQIAKVQQFRASLGDEGVLYWNFTTLQHFEELIRLHLARQIQVSLISQPSETTIISAPPGHGLESEISDDLGFLDLLDLLEEYSSQLVEITSRIATETVDLGTRMSESALEIQAAASQGQISRAEMKKLIEKAATHMNHFVTRIRTEVPLFREMTSKSVDVAGQAALLTIDFRSQDQKQLRDARDGLFALANVMEVSSGQISGLRTIVSRLPRLTANLNRAKRDTAAVLDEVIATIRDGRSVILETLKNLDSMTSDKGAVP